ncbi:peptidase M16 [Bacterioplanes sanyensis]|uniref:Protease 3 n=1 Tax=Bacterioplanes sanyensis TaxID=1249553 RepID=A0A222FMR0_9GAMM|nr:insulinase family protein [Bacterioplanes sanyensis]ASP40317.1 peptidase M16 [Bacterioplanes sanyensis]
MFSPRYWTFLLIVFAAIAFSMYRQLDTDTLVVSPSDPNDYRYLELDNGLKVLLIATSEADKAAAAVSVDVGSGDDPADRAGLAHFLEHMLFLGTDPYPDAGEYQAFISRNGGHHNAFTAHQQTTYFFELDNSALEDALDRFAPFFISPRFDEQYVEREKNAVHAEFKSKLKDDFRRIFSAQKQAMNPGHPYASFSTGNLDTLADRPDSTIREDLLEFYQQHYSADRMTLVLAGHYSLDQLQQWAVDKFSAIPKHNTAPRPQPPSLFVDGQLPLDMNIQPVKELRRLQFTFPMPASAPLYQFKPIQVLSNLIGHEGEGSLLAYLKQQGWAEGLSAGQSLDTEHDAAMVVQIQLTRAGLAHTEEITAVLMHYIELIKAEPLPQYLLDEQHQLGEMAFRFQEQSRLSDYVVSLSGNLLRFAAEDSIYGSFRWDVISQTQLQPFIDALDANNMLRTLIAPSVETDMQDPLYGTAMRIRPSNVGQPSVKPQDLAGLHLPVANPFIAEDLEPSAEQTLEVPAQILASPQREVWFYPEQDFKQPKSRIYAQFELASARDSERQRLLAHLYARSVNEALNTFSYPAHLAGLSYDLSANDQGLRLLIGGYSDKQPALLEQILQTMTQLQVDDAAFERYKASLQRSLQNRLKNKPFELTLAELRQWLYRPSFNEQQLLAALPDISADDLRAFSDTFAQQLYSRIFVHGGVDQARAETIAALVEQYLPANHTSIGLRDVLHIPNGSWQKNLNLDHPDNAITLYVQGDDTSDATRARYALLGQILRAPYYQYMRTEQQLGYVVAAAPYPQQTVPGLIFVVQSPDTAPEQLVEHSEIFLRQFATTLADMSAEEFVNHQQGLTTRLLQAPKNMSEKAARHWSELSIGRQTFDTNSAIAKLVNDISKDDIVALYQQHFSQPNPSSQARLLFSQGGDIDGWQTLSEVDRAKQRTF